MQLLSGWHERLDEASKTPPPKPRTTRLPKAPSYYSSGPIFVDSESAAEDMLDLARQRPLSHVGIDTEFQYSRPGVHLGGDKVYHDPRTVVPLVLSISMAEPKDGKQGALYDFVVDLRRAEVLPYLGQLFRETLPFVGHYLPAEITCLLQLGIRVPDTVWDTCIHEQALHLGRYHKAYKLRPEMDEVETIRAEEELREEKKRYYSLVSTCQRYGEFHPFAGDKKRLQQSFLEHEDGPFSQEQVEYAASDAVAAAQLYLPQILRAASQGILHHLITVEMPWVVTSARMSWEGAKIDQPKCQAVRAGCERHLESLMPKLREWGIENVRSSNQLATFFKKVGLLHLFRRKGRQCFEKDLLEQYEDQHEVIPLILAAKQCLKWQDHNLMTGELLGQDDRLHPEYRSLGAETGRTTSANPNIIGIGRVFRPLIVPEPGHGIGEVDLSRIEVGIAAAVYHDSRLMEMFNSEDVYLEMAKDVFREVLSEEDQQLSVRDFKLRHGKLRGQMKVCRLGLTYGMTSHGLAQQLKLSKSAAAALHERFMSLFPALAEALHDTAEFGGLRGYAAAVSGLRRYRGTLHGRLTPHERNWMINHPVQGSAAVVFKAAGNRLDRLYLRYGARLIVPVYDAFVFESPLENLEVVAHQTQQVMCDTVQEYFPMLHPKADINIEQPSCWNKEGDADSVEKWLENPTYSC